MLRAFGIAVACAAIWLAGVAPPLRADDTATIETCVQSESEANRDAHTCIGRVSGPCMEKPEGQSTVGMVACLSNETKAWDDLLNEEYGRLLPLLKKEAAEDVKKAQRLWIEGRDADCRVPYYFYDGGTIVQTLGAQCVRDHTAERALLIRAWREMAHGD
jgi:uncharacterized protein YecT (DUF1311 family)